MLAFLGARGVPVVVLAAAAAADALAAAAGGTLAPALTARFGGALLAQRVVFPAALKASSGARHSTFRDAEIMLVLCRPFCSGQQLPTPNCISVHQQIADSSIMDR
jgi:hypothetical protein